MGLSQKYLSDIEQNKVTPRADIVVHLARGARVAILLLIIFPKQMVSIGGFLVLLVVAGCLLLYSHEKKQEREREQVAVSVRYDPSPCNAKYPLLVVIRNSARKTVANVSWRFEAYRPGYSSNIASGVHV